MHPSTEAEAKRLFADIKKGALKMKGADIVVCPSFVHLREAKQVLNKSRVALGAQDIFWEESGAYTGEISPSMLRDLGVKFAIIGHSERRALCETDEMVNRKIKTALKHKIVPVICVGERERDTHGYYLAAVKRQVEHAFVGIAGTMIKNTVIAYEPVWAVGNKNFETPTPHDAVEMTIFIRKTLADKYGAKKVSDIRIIYGGSANPKNAGDFLREKEITGLLVGRESLKVKDFLAIATLR